MRELFRIVDNSSNLRFECIDDREYSIHDPDPMESMICRIRASLVYGYGLFNIHFTPSHRRAIRDFISHMNYQDDVGIMVDALLYVAQSSDDLLSVFDEKMDGVIPDSLDFEEFQRLSTPLFKIFDNMLGDALTARDEIDEYSYRRSIRTPLRNCIAIAAFGSPSKPFTPDEYHHVLEPYCCDHGCLLWDIINDIHHDMDPPIDDVPSKDIVGIISALQGLGIPRRRDPIYKTLSILAEKGSLLAKYEKFVSCKLITDIDFDTFAALTEDATKALSDNYDGYRI